MNSRASGKFFAVLLGIAVALFSLVSCDRGESALSFKSAVDEADVYIRNNQYTDALNALKKSERFANDPMSRLGLYRRYAKIGEKARAEKTLRKAAKKFSKSPEVLAVYGNFLLRQDRISEAEKITKPLRGTRYGSVYSEAALKKNSSGNLSTYLTKDFSAVYKDIFVGTMNTTWLVNAALVEVANGDYPAASALEEPIIRENRKLTSPEALFWALVQFDAENYDACLWNTNLVTNIKYTPVAASVASDCYTILDEGEKAESVRMSLISSDAQIPDSLAVNQALSDYRNGRYKRSYDLLTGVLARNPEYAPALLSYGKLSWIDSQPVSMTDLEMTLRQTTLRTESMKAYDERPRFLVEDAIEKLSSVEKKYQEKFRENRGESNIIDSIDELIVERISLYLRNNSDLPLKARTAEIWKTLEKNESGVNVYPAKLVYFAVQSLISFGYTDEARKLFMNYINARYMSSDRKDSGEKPVQDSVEIDIFGGERRVKAEVVPSSVASLAFGEKVAENAESMSVWEIELAAYFALIDNNAETARKLYEFVLFESGGVVNSGRGSYSASFENISPLASVSSAVNLSMIYSSTGEKESARSLYGLAAGRCENPVIKSKILHRIAQTQIGLGDYKGASLSVDYSLALDPQNAEARLLKRQLNGGDSKM